MSSRVLLIVTLHLSLVRSISGMELLEIFWHPGFGAFIENIVEDLVVSDLSN